MEGGGQGGWMQVLNCVGQREKGEGEEGGNGLQEDVEFKNNLSLFSFASLFRIERDQ